MRKPTLKFVTICERSIRRAILKTIYYSHVYIWCRGYGESRQDLYVGSTTNIQARFGAHQVVGIAEPIQDGDRIEKIVCDDIETAMLIEQDLIELLNPKYNVSRITIKGITEE